MIHVYPAGGPGLEHNTSDNWCWCGPKFGKLCFYCGGAKDGCDRCQGTGFLQVDEGDPEACLVLHKREGAAGLDEDADCQPIG